LDFAPVEMVWWIPFSFSQVGVKSFFVLEKPLPHKGS